MAHKIILTAEHPGNLDWSSRLTESTARTDKLSIYKARGGYVACLEWPHCLSGFFATEEAAREAQEEARALAQRRDRDRAQERCDMLNKLVGDDIFSPRD